jgi:hypothetical protein
VKKRVECAKEIVGGCLLHLWRMRIFGPVDPRMGIMEDMTKV